ncbi:unnamed protein product [Auanema sp. JU1783]|nr:unnamed protein product [Auanema sp. JU1783]
MQVNRITFHCVDAFLLPYDILYQPFSQMLLRQSPRSRRLCRLTEELFTVSMLSYFHMISCITVFPNALETTSTQQTSMQVNRRIFHFVLEYSLQIRKPKFRA